MEKKQNFKQHINILGKNNMSKNNRNTNKNISSVVSTTPEATPEATTPKKSKGAYSEAEETRLTELWNAPTELEENARLHEIAELMGKKHRSICAKLASMNLRRVDQAAKKNNTVRKETLAEEIGTLLEMPENDIDSLGKTNKSVLVLMLEVAQEYYDATHSREDTDSSEAVTS